jgi:hypothetical protein
MKSKQNHPESALTHSVSFGKLFSGALLFEGNAITFFRKCSVLPFLRHHLTVLFNISLKHISRQFPPLFRRQLRELGGPSRLTFPLCAARSTAAWYVLHAGDHPLAKEFLAIIEAEGDEFNFNDAQHISSLSMLCECGTESLFNTFFSLLRNANSIKDEPEDESEDGLDRESL